VRVARFRLNLVEALDVTTRRCLRSLANFTSQCSAIRERGISILRASRLCSHMRRILVSEAVSRRSSHLVRARRRYLLSSAPLRRLLGLGEHFVERRHCACDELVLLLTRPFGSQLTTCL
jgi:hypothetical protein